MNNSLLKSIMYVIPICCVIALAYIFNSFSPAQIGPPGILMVFVCIYLICLGVLFFILHIGLAFAARFIGKSKKLVIGPVESRKAYYVASIAAFLPVLLLGIQSVGQLQFSDILLVVVFISLAIFYVVKRA